MQFYKIWFIIRIPLIAVIIFYIIILLYFTINQSHFLYFPDHELAGTPAGIGLQYETVSFDTEDKVKLSGWFITAKGQRGVILFCHGNAGNISHRLESIQTFHSLGLSVFIFDYRGYGKSEGNPTEQGTYLDVKAAHNYLIKEKKVAPKEIIVFGRSIGGAIGAWISKEVEVKALIVESTFTSVSDLGTQIYPFIPVKLLSRFKYNAKEYLPKVNCPVLVIHSRDDEIIPFTHGKKLFEVANDPKQFLEIRGTHNDGFMISAENYKDGLKYFISKYAVK